MVATSFVKRHDSKEGLFVQVTRVNRSLQRIAAVSKHQTIRAEVRKQLLGRGSKQRPGLGTVVDSVPAMDGLDAATLTNVRLI